MPSCRHRSLTGMKCGKRKDGALASFKEHRFTTAPVTNLYLKGRTVTPACALSSSRVTPSAAAASPSEVVHGRLVSLSVTPPPESSRGRRSGADIRRRLCPWRYRPEVAEAVTLETTDKPPTRAPPSAPAGPAVPSSPVLGFRQEASTDGDESDTTADTDTADFAAAVKSPAGLARVILSSKTAVFESSSCSRRRRAQSWIAAASDPCRSSAGGWWCSSELDELPPPPCCCCCCCSSSSRSYLRELSSPGTKGQPTRVTSSTACSTRAAARCFLRASSASKPAPTKSLTRRCCGSVSDICGEHGPGRRRGGLVLTKVLRILPPGAPRVARTVIKCRPERV